jgi:cytosine permease
MASLLKYIESKADGRGADDYARIPVPEDKKRSWMGSAVVYVGCAISLSAFLLGGTLASGLSLTQAIIAVFVGTLLLAAMACICAQVAMYTGLSTPMIGKFTFGQKGAVICGLLYAMCAWGWFGVQAGLFGDTVAQMYNLMTGNTMSGMTIKVVIMLGGILMTSSAIFGFKSIEKLSKLAIPLIAVLMISSLVVVLRGHTYSDLNNSFITNPMTLGAGISLVIGSFAAGAVGSPDILRYAKNFKDTAKAMVVGMVVGFGITVIISAFCAKAVGDANIVTIMIGLGWGMLAMLVLVLAQWTSNDNNVYSGSLGFSVVFENIPKYQLAIMVGLTGTLFAVLGISNKLIWFFSILGIFTPPIGGCYVADFFLCKKYYNFENLKNVPTFRKETMIAYFLASGVGFLTTAPPTGLGLLDITTVPAVDTFIAAFILQIIFVKLLNKNHCKDPEYIK